MILVSPPHLIPVRPRTDSGSDRGVYSSDMVLPHTCSAVIRESNTCLNALLALKLGKKDTIGSRCVQGATKSGMMAQHGATRGVMLG